MSENKSIQIVLKDKELNYRLPSNTKILDFKWECCISSICIKYLQDVDIFASISTNLVSDIKYNKKGQVQNFFPTITQFLLKGKKNQTQFQEFEKTWFRINNPGEEIKLYVTKLFDDQNSSIPLDVKLQMSVWLLIKKV